jgi:anti-sigma regulatory factor (Ser/Thr protein kinase)
MAGPPQPPPVEGRVSLLHQALLYRSPDEFAAAMAPFAREGLERGDSVLAATTPANIAALTAELGPDAVDCHLHDTADWHPRPADRLLAVRRMVDALPAGTELRAMGEPLWRGTDAVRREWARYEAIINLALAGSPLRFVCLYDAASLPEDVLAHARNTHPEVQVGGPPRPSDSFVAPERYVAGLAGISADGGLDLPVDDDHHRFRRALIDVARASGLSQRRAEDLVIAANEVVSNAELHGAPPVAARVWTTADELVCEVSDGGAGIADPLAGWGLPANSAREGWGLSIARQLCDALEVRHDGRGSSVSLHVSLG